MKTSYVSLCAIVALGLSMIGVSASQAQTSRPTARPRPVIGQAVAQKVQPKTIQRPATVGGIAQASPDLVIIQSSITGPATLHGIFYHVPVSLKVKNVGSVKAGFFNMAVFYAQPVGNANPSLNQYTGLSNFLTAAGGNVGVLELNPGQEVTLVGIAAVPAAGKSGKTLYLRGWADKDSLEFPSGHGSVSELNESNNWSTQMSVMLP